MDDGGHNDDEQAGEDKDHGRVWNFLLVLHDGPKFTHDKKKVVAVASFHVVDPGMEPEIIETFITCMFPESALVWVQAGTSIADQSPISAAMAPGGALQFLLILDYMAAPLRGVRRTVR